MGVEIDAVADRRAYLPMTSMVSGSTYENVSFLAQLSTRTQPGRSRARRGRSSRRVRLGAQRQRLLARGLVRAADCARAAAASVPDARRAPAASRRDYRAGTAAARPPSSPQAARDLALGIHQVDDIARRALLASAPPRKRIPAPRSARACRRRRAAQQPADQAADARVVVSGVDAADPPGKVVGIAFAEAVAGQGRRVGRPANGGDWMPGGLLGRMPTTPRRLRCRGRVSPAPRRGKKSRHV